MSSIAYIMNAYWMREEEEFSKLLTKLPGYWLWTEKDLYLQLGERSKLNTNWEKENNLSFCFPTIVILTFMKWKHLNIVHSEDNSNILCTLCVGEDR